jgi:NDP-sugar pyrophosphorylase family protein
MMPPVAILAGGLATRLRPITETIPKALVPVAGQPFLTHQLAYLRDQGIERVVLCLGYLGEMVREEFGGGDAFGLRIEYSFDGPVLLGTAGAVRQALPLLGREFFVLYGDSYLPIDFGDVALRFADSGKPGLMTIYPNGDRWDTSNVWFENGEIRMYDKKKRVPEMHHIDYGLSVFRAEVFENAPADLADVMSKLARCGELAGYEATERFYEIGSHTGLAELDALLSGRRP